MRAGLNQLTMRSGPYFYIYIVLQTNAIAKYGADLEREKMNLNGTGKRKLGQVTNYGTD